MSYIRADETPHVEYLKTVLTEMRDRTFVGTTGTRYAGTDLVGGMAGKLAEPGVREAHRLEPPERACGFRQALGADFGLGVDDAAHLRQKPGIDLAGRVDVLVAEALQRVVHLRSKLDDTRAQRTRLDQRTAEITGEHARIRENMQRLQQNSDLYNRYVKKLDQQETELERLRKDIEGIRNSEEEHRRELQNYLTTLDVA